MLCIGVVLIVITISINTCIFTGTYKVQQHSQHAYGSVAILNKYRILTLQDWHEHINASAVTFIILYNPGSKFLIYESLHQSLKKGPWSLNWYSSKNLINICYA